jgi:hypothetical protein
MGKKDPLPSRIRSMNRGILREWWLISAILWLISIFVPISEWNSLIDKKDFTFWSLIGPLAATGFLVYCVLLQISWFKFGESWLVLDPTPAIPGEELRGRIHLSAAIPEVSLFDLKITCINRVVTGFGKGRSADNIVLRKIKLRKLPVDPAIPNENSKVSFHLVFPAGGKPSDKRNSRNTICWYVEASSTQPGMNYSAIWEIPVDEGRKKSTGPCELRGSGRISGNRSFAWKNRPRNERASSISRATKSRNST